MKEGWFGRERVADQTTGQANKRLDVIIMVLILSPSFVI